MCSTSLKYVDARNNLAIIEAWNEWGEGSFIEPDREFGFAFLDRVRNVYTDAPDDHTDYVPDATRIASFSMLKDEELAQARALESQPYPDPPLALRSTQTAVDVTLPPGVPLKAWEFNTDSTEDWEPYQTDPLRVANGVLTAQAAGDDPQLIAKGVDVAIDTIGAIALRLRVPQGVRSGEAFWSTETEPVLSQDKSFRFPLMDDDEWHTYWITKKIEGKWTGTLGTLRFDLGQTDDTIAIDWIRLYR